MYNNGVNYYQPNATQQQMFRQPNTTAFPPTLQGLKGRPVASLEEVRAASIDFDGSVFFFPDLANTRIYTKQSFFKSLRISSNTYGKIYGRK